MKCLYCGGPLTLALLKKITGAGEFCSDECRRGYQSEFNRLAVGRLQQARANRRVPLPAEQASHVAAAPEFQPVAEVATTMPPITAAVADVPPAPIWSQSPLPAPAPSDSSPDVATPIFLREPAAPSVPALRATPDREPFRPALGNLFEAIREESDLAARPSAPVRAEQKSAEESRSKEEDELWMAPRGLFPLTVRLQAIEAGLKIPHLSPAPIFVYLQLPESLIANSVGRPRLSVAPASSFAVRPRDVAPSAVFSEAKALVQGLRRQLDTGRLRVAERMFPSPAGFGPDCSVGLTFPWPAPAAPTVLPHLRFRPASAAVMYSFQTDFAPADSRFDVYLHKDGRNELRDKLRGLAERRANQRAMGDQGPTVTLPLKTVEPALNLLAAFGTAILERQNRAGDVPPLATAPPAVGLPSEDLLPRLVAGLTGLGDRPLAGSVDAQPDGSFISAPNGGAPPSGPVPSSSSPVSGHEGYAPQGLPSATSTAGGHSGVPAAPLSPQPQPLSTPPTASYPPAAPAYGPDGLPSGWPADVPPPAELTAPVRTPAVSPEPRQSSPSPAAPPAPPMPGINGNVYMFGTEINAKAEEEETSTALAKTTGGEVEKAPSQETETSDHEPNFTRPSGFPLSGGGMMNVGTMVVVNQPSGTVNINANSATASTFESRLRSKKDPTPLSSIAEAVGMQIPPPQPAKEMPLRMNFQGRLETALPVKWPELEMTAMRKKMFFGGPLKSRRAGGTDSLASAPQPPLPRMPVANSPATPEPASEQEKAGAMGWIKSISNRFGKK